MADSIMRNKTKVNTKKLGSMCQKLPDNHTSRMLADGHFATPSMLASNGYPD
jgi:hypothetical protein